MRKFAQDSFLARLTAFAFAAATLLTTGCGMGSTSTTFVPSTTAAATWSGKMMGGNQPIGGATVTLWAAGTGGYGSASTQYAQTTTSTDGQASFSFNKAATPTGPTAPTTNSYGCPSGSDPQMYLIGAGGNTLNTGSNNNTAAVFILTLGKCSAINDPALIVNEITTVATIAAVQQYFNPATESLGYPASVQAAQGYANALLAIPTLANVAYGTANTATQIAATPAGATAAVTVTALPETAKLVTIANILAACVNNAANTAANCTTLFANALPPPNVAVTSQPTITMPTATDTLQAAYYMQVNPASMKTAGTANATGMKALFGLIAAAGAAYPGSLTGSPTDWTLGIRYSSTSACGYGTFLLASYVLEADANGNIWVAAGGTSTTSSNLIELLPNGTPATCALGNLVAGTKGLTIDTGGNVWIAGNTAGAPYYKYNIAAGTSTPYPTSTATVPYAVAADGTGNIFYTDAANTAVNEFVGGAASMAAVSPVNIATVSTTPFFLAVDTTGTLIVPNSAVSTTVFLYDIYPSTGLGNTNNYLTTSVGSTSNVVNPYAVAVGLGGKFYLGNSTSGSSTVSQTAYSLTQTNGTATFSANTAQYAADLGGVRGPNAIDGAGNVWYANSVAPTGNYAAGATGAYSISELSAALVSMGADGQTGGFQKASAIINTAPRGLTIDPSGNVWGGSNSATGNGVFEIVGAAVPVVTPISASLAKSIAAGSPDGVSKP